MLTGKDLRAPDRAPPLRFAGVAAFCSSGEAYVGIPAGIKGLCSLEAFGVDKPRQAQLRLTRPCRSLPGY